MCHLWLPSLLDEFPSWQKWIIYIKGAVITQPLQFTRTCDLIRGQERCYRGMFWTNVHCRHSASVIVCMSEGWRVASRCLLLQLWQSFSSDYISLRPRSLQVQRGRVFEAAGLHNHLQIPSILHTHHPGFTVKYFVEWICFGVCVHA